MRKTWNFILFLKSMGNKAFKKKLRDDKKMKPNKLQNNEPCLCQNVDFMQSFNKHTDTYKMKT